MPTVTSDFGHQWRLLEEGAREVIAESPSNPAHVQLVLNRLTATLFGLDESLKQKANNALDLIIQLVQSSAVGVGDEAQEQAVSEPISLAALKAIKSCIIRNPAGRNACRAAGVFPFLHSTLLHHGEDPILVEEAMTTLAAMCLSNDLNALQATMQFRTHVDAAATRFADRSSLIQKLTYLKALFATMQREQKALLKRTSIDNPNIHDAMAKMNLDFDTSLMEYNHVLLWDHVAFAERTLQQLVPKVGVKDLNNDKNNNDPTTVAELTNQASMASQALEQCALYTSHTKLLDPLVWNLHLARANIYHSLLLLHLMKQQQQQQKQITSTADSFDTEHDFDSGLADLDYCLSTPPPPPPAAATGASSLTAHLQFLRAKMLFAMSNDNGRNAVASPATATNRLNDAKEALAKAIVLDPSKHAEWSAQMGLFSMNDTPTKPVAPEEL